MADRKTWGNRLMIAGGVAFGVGLILRLVWSGKAGTGKRGTEPAGTCNVWLRSGGLFIGDRKVSTGEILNSCGKVALQATGDSKYGDLIKLETALQNAGIPII